MPITTKIISPANENNKKLLSESDIDQSVTETGANPVSGAAVYNALKTPPVDLEKDLVIGKYGDNYKIVKNGYNLPVTPTYAKIKKYNDYLYELWYDDINYNFADTYFKTQKVEVPVGGCSVIRKGDLFGRNLDWYYDNDITYIVNTESMAGRFGSIGVTSTFSVDRVNPASSEPNDMFGIIPFMLSDGINEKGVVCNINVAPGTSDDGDYDKGENKVIEPTGEVEVEISSLQLIRYILDNFASATEAVEYLRHHVRIYQPKMLLDLNYQSHFMLADSTDTYVLEFINNKLEDVNFNTELTGKTYLTNFHLIKSVSNGTKTLITLNSDGTVYTPKTQTSPTANNAFVTNGISLYGCGLERYNIIKNEFSNISSEASMKTLLFNLAYSKAYSTSASPADPRWDTEFVHMPKVKGGSELLTVKNAYTDFDSIQQRTGTAWIDKDGVWWTTHSVIYNIKSRTLTLYIREDDSAQYNLALPLLELAPENAGNYISITTESGIKKINSTFEPKLQKLSISADKNIIIGEGIIDVIDSAVALEEINLTTFADSTASSRSTPCLGFKIGDIWTKRLGDILVSITTQAFRPNNSFDKNKLKISTDSSFTNSILSTNTFSTAELANSKEWLFNKNESEALKINRADALYIKITDETGVTDRASVSGVTYTTKLLNGDTSGLMANYSLIIPGTLPKITFKSISTIGKKITSLDERVTDLEPGLKDLPEPDPDQSNKRIIKNHGAYKYVMDTAGGLDVSDIAMPAYGTAELWIKKTVAGSVTWPDNLIWVAGDEDPSLAEGHIHCITFRNDAIAEDKILANLAYSYEISTGS